MRISDWSSDVCSSDLADHPSTAAARNGAARRQHNLRNGAARGISAAVCTLAALRRLGSGGDRSLASLAQVGPYYPRAVARCQATALAPSSRAGSGSNIGIEGGMSTGARSLPSAQASMLSDHSCLILRLCASLHALLSTPRADRP